jgi:hypothetical protein
MVTTHQRSLACQLRVTVPPAEQLSSVWLVELSANVLLDIFALSKLTPTCLTFLAKLMPVPRVLTALKVPKHPSDALSDSTPSNWELNSYLSVQIAKLDTTVIMISLNRKSALKERTALSDPWSLLTALVVHSILLR